MAGATRPPEFRPPSYLNLPADAGGNSLLGLLGIKADAKTFDEKLVRNMALAALIGTAAGSLKSAWSAPAVSLGAQDGIKMSAKALPSASLMMRDVGGLVLPLSFFAGVFTCTEGFIASCTGKYDIRSSVGGAVTAGTILGARSKTVWGACLAGLQFGVVSFVFALMKDGYIQNPEILEKKLTIRHEMAPDLNPEPKGAKN